MVSIDCQLHKTFILMEEGSLWACLEGLFTVTEVRRPVLYIAVTVPWVRVLDCTQRVKTVRTNIYCFLLPDCRWRPSCHCDGLYGWAKVTHKLPLPKVCHNTEQVINAHSTYEKPTYLKRLTLFLPYILCSLGFVLSLKFLRYKVWFSYNFALVPAF